MSRIIEATVMIFFLLWVLLFVFWLTTLILFIFGVDLDASYAGRAQAAFFTWVAISFTGMALAPAIESVVISIQKDK